MPTPRSVRGVNSSGEIFQRRLRARRTIGVARGTTLHNAAPSRASGPAKRFVKFGALPPNQFAVGKPACLTTRWGFARPRCVCVLPMSMSNILFKVLPNRGLQFLPELFGKFFVGGVHLRVRQRPFGVTINEGVGHAFAAGRQRLAAEHIE